MSALYQVQNISKTFGKGAAVVKALDQVTLGFDEGEFTALVGPSGSGKTTLLNILGCLDKPGAGTVTFHGRDLTALNSSELSKERLYQIGFIFQDYNLIPTLSALENVSYVLWLQKVRKDQIRSKAEAVLKRVGLGALMSRRPHQLSRGQQQRVAVSRAIVHSPRVVLGDELTANLDHKTGLLLMDFLREINAKDKITFIYATHDPMMIEKATRVVKLEDGKLVSDGKQ